MTEHSVQNLIHLFLKTNDIKKLVNEAAEVIKNPIVLCDTSYHIIAHSPADSVSDQSWRKGMNCESWSYSFVSKISNCDLDYSGHTHTTQILTNINADSSKRRKIGTLCSEGIHLGYYLLLEEFTPFDEVSEETYYQVEMILSKCMLLDRPLHPDEKLNVPERIILDLLQHRFENEQAFQARIEKNELMREGSFLLICMDLKELRKKYLDEKKNDNKIISDIRSTIGHCLPLSWQVVYHDRIVILTDLHSISSNKNTMLEHFRAYLDEIHQYAGCSCLFSDSFLLRKYYEQAVAALELGRAFEDERALFFYEDYKIYDLFRHSSVTDLFAQFGTDVIQSISQYDTQNGTDYLETVEHYIGNRCSVRKAAEAMYVHRNTIVYRISRIEELFGLTFENDYSNYLNYTACLLHKYCKYFSSDQADTL